MQEIASARVWGLGRFILSCWSQYYKKMLRIEQLTRRPSSRTQQLSLSLNSTNLLGQSSIPSCSPSMSLPSNRSQPTSGKQEISFKAGLFSVAPSCSLIIQTAISLRQSSSHLRDHRFSVRTCLTFQSGRVAGLNIDPYLSAEIMQEADSLATWDAVRWLSNSPLERRQSSSQAMSRIRWMLSDLQVPLSNYSSKGRGRKIHFLKRNLGCQLLNILDSPQSISPKMPCLQVQSASGTRSIISSSGSSLRWLPSTQQISAQSVITLSPSQFLACSSSPCTVSLLATDRVKHTVDQMDAWQILRVRSSRECRKLTFRLGLSLCLQQIYLRSSLAVGLIPSLQFFQNRPSNCCLALTNQLSSSILMTKRGIASYQLISQKDDAWWRRRLLIWTWKKRALNSDIWVPSRVVFSTPRSAESQASAEPTPISASFQNIRASSSWLYFLRTLNPFCSNSKVKQMQSPARMCRCQYSAQSTVHLKGGVVERLLDLNLARSECEAGMGSNSLSIQLSCTGEDMMNSQVRQTPETKSRFLQYLQSASCWQQDSGSKVILRIQAVFCSLVTISRSLNRKRMHGCTLGPKSLQWLQCSSLRLTSTTPFMLYSSYMATSFSQCLLSPSSLTNAALLSLAIS